MADEDQMSPGERSAYANGFEAGKASQKAIKDYGIRLIERTFAERLDEHRALEVLLGLLKLP